MDLGRDLLDHTLVDRTGRAMGRVDGIVLECAPGMRPRVAWLEIGPTVLARRLHPRLGTWLARLLGRFDPHLAVPTRVSPRALRDAGVDIELDVSASEIGAMRAERWLRRHVVGRIPGARG